MAHSPLEQLERFFASYKLIRYKKGETILRAEEEPTGVFYLQEGYVRVYSLSDEGKELTLIIFKPQDFFPMVWAINSSSNLYYVEALTPAKVYKASREEFIKFLKINPEVLFELTNKILIRLSGLLRRMESLVFGNAATKVAAIMQICAERFGKSSTKGTLIQVPLIHKEIANLIGMSRETVSLEIKGLEKEGIISRQGRLFIIKNMARLKRRSRNFIN